MVEILLSSLISCSDAQRIALNVQTMENMSASIKRDLMKEIEIASPKNCKLPEI
tara:strand:- start:490 stop:651 length:162 start_codon:yes stop_codon:yes gene_type:complete